MIATNFSGDKKATLYPNPMAAASINVQRNFQSDSPIEVIATDLNARMMLRYIVTASSFAIPVEIPSGLYLFKHSSSGFSQVTRVLLK